MTRPISLADLGPDAARQAAAQIAAQWQRQRRGRGNPEEAFHRAVAAYLQWALPPSVVWMHCPVGGKRPRGEAGKLKAMGTRAGVPDLCIMWRRELTDYAYAPAMLWIELKSSRGSLSQAQHDFIAAVERIGHGVAVCRSLEDVRLALAAHHVPLSGGSA